MQDAIKKLTGDERNSFNEAVKRLTEDKKILVDELKNYGANKAKGKDNYSCVFCPSSDALNVHRDEKENNKYNYKCFSCQKFGDVINLIAIKENVKMGKAIRILADKYNIELPKQTPIKVDRVNVDNIVDFYKKGKDEAIKKGDLDKAFELECESDNEIEKNYYVNFKYIDNQYRPKPIWENLECILDKEGIKCKYNEISKNTDIEGLDCEEFNSQVIDIHSLSHRYGLKLSIDYVGKALSRVGRKNTYNPVVDFLCECELNWDNETGRIRELCDTLQVADWFSKDLRDKLVIKWLLNVARIPFNTIDLQFNTEGVLVIQGEQGIGKTTWIKKLIPLYLKTGLELDPSDKDKIYNCIKYWVCELGELDATMKAEQAKLKAFLTESIDEMRRPYAINPERYPRNTAFYGTVNKSEFLKDETGDRRYWVIPVIDIDIDKLDKIDIKQLWGEVMHLLSSKAENLHLTREELKELNESNKDFRAKGALQITIDEGFNWNIDKRFWNVVSSTVIAKKLGLKTTSGLKEAIEANGGEFKRTKKARGYLVPSFKDENTIKWDDI